MLPSLIPVSKELGSEGLLLVAMKGKLPMIGSRRGPGGNFGGFLVPLYIRCAIKTTKMKLNT